MNNDKITAPTTLALIRRDDPTGVSGTGHVADVVRHNDGTCSLRWKGPGASSVTYDAANGGLMRAIEVHGHGGASVLELLPAFPQHRSSFEQGWSLAHTAECHNWPVAHYQDCATVPDVIEGGHDNEEAEQGWYAYFAGRGRPVARPVSAA